MDIVIRTSQRQHAVSKRLIVPDWDVGGAYRKIPVSWLRNLLYVEPSCGFKEQKSSKIAKRPRLLTAFFFFSLLFLRPTAGKRPPCSFVRSVVPVNLHYMLVLRLCLHLCSRSPEHW